MQPEEIRKHVDQMGLDVLVQRLTQAPPEDETDSETVSLAKTLFDQDVPEREQFEGETLLAAWHHMNSTFLDRQWGDGFPLVAPTPAEVTRMLTGTRRAPTDVVARMEPCLGTATVEKIAINAVMAGCKPEHLPVLIAAVEAMVDPRYELRHVATSTSPYTPCLVVNGPIAKRIGMNSGMGCLGPGAPSAVNTVIGRAIRLILMNIAGAYLGVTDVDTIGDPNKYSMALAEREEKNPWEPLHVERGYEATESTVTVFVAGAAFQHNDHSSREPEQFLRRMARAICNPGSPATARYVVLPEKEVNPREMKPTDYEQDCLIILCPNHAAMLSANGWSKQGIKEVLHQFAKMRIGDGAGTGMNFVERYGKENARVRPEWAWLQGKPDMEITAYRSPDNFQLVVAGADSQKSMIVLGGKKSITRRIEE